jgi:hypothetical protein
VPQGRFAAPAANNPNSEIGPANGTDGYALFLTKWHFKQHLLPNVQPYSITIIGVGVNEAEGLWFDTSAEGYDPYAAAYTCTGVLTDPQKTK